ncbi:MAG: SRPBCC family protein [Acidobacteriota bacterium]|nr:SRPBCC family protein [Acidobacteriota bacterium]
MDPLSTSVLIDAPRDRVFEYLADIANHPEFTDHFLVDWRLTRELSIGRGAGARFRVKAPANRFAWGDVSFSEVLAPRRIVEVGRQGKGNRIRTLGVWELREASSGTTRVTFTYQSESATPWDRMSEALGGRLWLARQQRRAMRRLRRRLESERSERPAGARGSALPPGGSPSGGPAGRITVAGG